MVTAIPSSIPYVHIDPELTGAVISREAAIAVAARRADDRIKQMRAMIDAEAKLRALEHERDDAVKLADKHSWWGNYGATTILVATLVSLGVGFGVGYGAAPRK